MNGTNRQFDSRRERGIAMLVTLFTLLLLSVVGLGMMYSTNMESAINSNFRDKQTAIYAAMAGLQEARDRLRPYALNQPVPIGRIVPPADLPSLTGDNVIYIVNPKSGESVRPWRLNNPYMDTELCHENILGLSGTPGVPCTTLPTGNSWFQVYNDAQMSAAFWRFANPLDFKWVRITLKGNNNTAVAVNGDSADARQVCWDGTRQLVLPPGYGPNCTRFGSVIAVLVTNQGTNYTSPPTVTIDSPPVGIQATATANLTPVDGAVGAVDVTSEGSDYTSVPTVTIDPPADPSGTQATAHVCVSYAECPNPYIPPGAAIAGVTVTDSGTACYATGPAVLFTGGGGSSASATAALQGGPTSCIAAWSVSGVCKKYKNDTVTGLGLSGGGGTGFSGTLKFDSLGNVVTGYPTVESSGTDFVSNPTSITGLTGCGGLTFSVTRGRRVASPQIIAPTSGGNGYTSTPAVSFAAGSGTADTLASGTATLGAEPPEARKVRQIIVDNSGSGYTSAPNVTISGGGGAGAAASATLASGGVYKVTSITVTNQGSGYTTDPNITLTGGGGAGATAKPVLGNGANWGKIFLITALAQTRSGARTMLQMEATTAITGYHSIGALTIDGPNPVLEKMPNSQPFDVSGFDANSCGQTAVFPRPAVGGYDDPNADPPTHSVEDIVDALPDDRLDHYIGEGSPPSVRNVYESLGETLGTTTGLRALIDSVQAKKTNTGNTVDFGTPSRWAYNYIEGDLTLSGNTNGYGVLVVTGTLRMTGNFTWYGTVLVVGDGVLDYSGGGNGDVVGSVLVAKIYPDPAHHASTDLLATLGSPTINWNGGGGNSITYDHCWADNVMSTIPVPAPVSLRPLKVLSLRTLPY